MARVNLTLEPDTYERLTRHAEKHGRRLAVLAREFIREGLERLEAAERRTKLAADYHAGRRDSVDLVSELEAAQLEILGEEDDA